MTVRTMIHIEAKVDDHTFVFSIPMGCNYGQAYNGAFQVLQKVIELSNDAIASLEKKDNKESVAQEDK